MVELTIQCMSSSWWVAPKYQTANRMHCPIIECSSPEEAMSIFQQLNGKKLQEIEAFIKLRKKLNA